MIDRWLDSLKLGWQNGDLPAVMGLFSDDVEYWETPFKKLASKETIQREWKAIKNQSDISVTTAIFSEVDHRFAVRWELSYMNEQHEEKHWAGTYLIELNQDGKCTYFHQTGEQAK